MDLTRKAALLFLWLTVSVTVIAAAGNQPAKSDLSPSVATNDLRALIAARLAAGEKKIVIPPGRYCVAPENGSHLRFHDLQGVEIIAEHVEMVCGATVQAIGFEHCTNVTLRGLTVDYDPLPFTEGKIVALGPDKSWVEFELFDGYPEAELVERIEIFNPVTLELRRASHYGWGVFERVGTHRYRVSKGPNYHYRAAVDTEEVGDILVTNHRTPGRGYGHAVLASACSHLTLEDVTLYASPIFGFLENDCTASTYRRCKVDRRAPDDDPVKRAYPRLRSLNADAFHSKNAPIGPAIIGCFAHWQGDDCVNINGRYYYVAGSQGKTIRFISIGKPALGVGDAVGFLPYNGPLPSNAIVLGIQPDPLPLSSNEISFIKNIDLVNKVRKRLLGNSAIVYKLTLDRDVELMAGSAIFAADRVGDGFAVKDCDFGDNRSRGILIKASHGEVTGNRIYRSRMAAVLISPEFQWLEAGCSSDVSVKENHIEGIGQTPIQVHAVGGDGQPLPAGAHRNLTIQNNQFVDCPWPLIEVVATSGLKISDNVFPKNLPPALTPTKVFHQHSPFG